MSVHKPKSFSLISAGLALALSLPITATASDWTGNAKLMLGVKQMEDKDWSDDKHEAMAVAFDFQRKSWPVAIAIDLMGAGSEEGSGADLVEDISGGLHLGVRKYWQFEASQLRPYLGGGLAMLVAERRLGSESSGQRKDDDGATGVWLGGGVDWMLAEHFSVGVEARYSQAEASLFGSDVEAGGFFTGAHVGTHW